MPTIPGIENVNWGGIAAQTAYWGGMILLSIVIIAIFVFVYFYLQYTIKADVWDICGSGKNGIFTIGTRKKNKFRWIDDKQAWRPLFPLFNKMRIEPFDPEFIYPGKRVYTFKIGDSFVPGRINITQSESEIKATINPVPYYIRNWQSYTHKRNNLEFSEHNFWKDNRHFILGVITVAICCTLAGATIYFSYKFATGGRESIAALTSAIKDIGVIKSIAPG